MTWACELDSNTDKEQGTSVELELTRFRGCLILWEGGSHDAENKTPVFAVISPTDGCPGSFGAQADRPAGAPKGLRARRIVEQNDDHLALRELSTGFIFDFLGTPFVLPAKGTRR